MAGHEWSTSNHRSDDCEDRTQTMTQTAHRTGCDTFHVADLTPIRETDCPAWSFVTTFASSDKIGVSLADLPLCSGTTSSACNSANFGSSVESTFDTDDENRKYNTTPCTSDEASSKDRPVVLDTSVPIWRRAFDEARA